jgi:hypothetical protein
VEPVVADAGVGAELNQHAGSVDFASPGGVVQGGFPLLFHRGVGPGARVDVPAELGQQREGGPGAPAGGPHHQPGPLRAGRGGMAGQPLGRPPVACQRGGDEPVRPLGRGPRHAAVLNQPVKHRRAAADRGDLGRRPAVAGVHAPDEPVLVGLERSPQVGTVLGEQPHPVAHVVRDRPLQLPADQLARGVAPHPEARPPWPAVAAAKPVAEQQREVAVVAAELPVVQRLPVIGVRPGR